MLPNWAHHKTEMKKKAQNNRIMKRGKKQIQRENEKFIIWRNGVLMNQAFGRERIRTRIIAVYACVISCSASIFVVVLKPMLLCIVEFLTNLNYFFFRSIFNFTLQPIQIILLGLNFYCWQQFVATFCIEILQSSQSSSHLRQQ